MVSPALKKQVMAVDVFRKGTYCPTKWDSFENITKDKQDRFQASDHLCLWAEFQL